MRRWWPPHRAEFASPLKETDRTTKEHAVGGRRAAPQPDFAGFEQQDASEFLAKLLEGLGEDLNRVEHKPYVEMPAADEATPDHALAAAAWTNHVRREDHPVTAALTGQMHSMMECAASGERRVSFEVREKWHGV